MLQSHQQKKKHPRLCNLPSSTNAQLKCHSWEVSGLSTFLKLFIRSARLEQFIWCIVQQTLHWQQNTRLMAMKVPQQWWMDFVYFAGWTGELFLGLLSCQTFSHCKPHQLLLCSLYNYTLRCLPHDSTLLLLLCEWRGSPRRRLLFSYKTQTEQNETHSW